MKKIIHPDLLYQALKYFEENIAAFTQANLNLIQQYQKKIHSLEWKVLWIKTRDPYFVWLSEIMLQQTNITTVIPKFRNFVRKFPSINDFAKADTSEIQLELRGLGYYRRFRLMHDAAKKLISNSTFQWPKTFEEWKSLPGIGNYTAAAISSICYNEAHAVVDGNIERVLCRIFNWNFPANDPSLKKIYPTLAQRFLIHEFPGDHNQAFMELGQDICTPTKWDCNRCPFQKICLSNLNLSQSTSPLPKIKNKIHPVEMEILIPINTNSDKIGLYQRSDHAKFLKNTFGFLNFLKTNSVTAIQDLYILDGYTKTFRKPKTKEDGSLNSLEYFNGNIKHSITHHAIHAKVSFWELNVSKNNTLDIKLNWIPLHQVESQLLSNLDRKAWKKAEAFLLERGMRLGRQNNRKRSKKFTSDATDKTTTHKSGNIRSEL